MMMKRAARCVRPTLLPVVVLALWGASSATLNGQTTEVKAAREKIEALLEQAERLQDEGRADKAEQLVKEAKELKQELAHARSERSEHPRGEEILKGLKSGAKALRALGRAEEAERLERIAAKLRGSRASEGERRDAKSEREVAMEQLKTMRIAMQGLLDGGREDSAEQLHRAIRSREVALEGRRDEEAQKIREAAPTLGQRVELLMFAADKLREAGKTEQAQVVDNFGEQLRKRFRDQRAGERDSEHADSSPEARVAAEQIKVMQTALVALREGERRDAADLLKRAIQARQVRLRRMKGAEAEIVLEREPKLGNTVEVLALASRLWREFGNEKNAATVGQLAELWTGRERGLAREQKFREADAILQKHFEDKLAELESAIDRVNARVKELRRELSE